MSIKVIQFVTLTLKLFLSENRKILCLFVKAAN